MKKIIILSELLNLFNLSNSTNSTSSTELNILAGKNGLNRGISKVSVLDAPDGPKWLKGNELILTSAYIFEDETQLYDFVVDLIDIGASGLGIKLGRYLTNLPDRLLELANDNDFPIIYIPYKFVWSDIIGVFYELWYSVNSNRNIKKYELGKLEEIYESFNWGSYQLMMKLTELYNIPMAVISQNKHIIADNGLSGVEDIFLKINNSKFSFPDISYEILNVKEYYIIVQLIPFSEIVNKEYLVLKTTDMEHGTEIIELFKLLENYKQKNKFMLYDRKQLYRRFLQDLILDKNTSNRIKEFDKNRNYIGKVYNGIMIITGKLYEEVYDELKRIAQRYKTGLFQLVMNKFYNDSTNELLVLMEWINAEDIENINTFVRKLLYSLDESFFINNETYIYVGNMYESFENIRDSYLEACDTKNTGRFLWENQRIYFYDNLNFYKSLSKDDYAKIDFSDIHLLESKDNQLMFNCIETLETYIEMGGYKNASEKLYIHENTLRYRIKRISELLNIDLDSYYLCHNVIIKIKLWKLKQLQLQK